MFTSYDKAIVAVLVILVIYGIGFAVQQGLVSSEQGQQTVEAALKWLLPILTGGAVYAVANKGYKKVE